MSDSQTIEFHLKYTVADSFSSKHTTNVGKAFSKVGVIVVNGVPTKANSLTDNARGLTKAQNKVKACLDERYPFHVTAYWGSFNSPGSLIGNNALIENLVYLSCVGDKLILQKFLLQNGCDAGIVKQIKLKDSELKSLTLTYLFRFASHDDAVDALDEFYHHADMALCEHYPGPSLGKGKGKKKNVVPTGSKPERTIYINKDPTFKVVGYVKAGKHGRAFAQFNSKAEENAVYAESAHYVRIEIVVTSSWLIKYQLQSPLAWKGAAGPKAYEKALLQLRALLRLNDHWRVKAPQPSHIASLSSGAKDVLDDHLKGKANYQIGSLVFNAKDVPLTIRKELWSVLDIDIGIPWSIQSQQASNNLGNWLKWNAPFQAPKHLQRLCYVRSTVEQKIDQLKQDVDVLFAQAQSAHAGKKTTNHTTAKLGAALSEITQHLESLYKDEGATETSDISNLMG